MNFNKWTLGLAAVGVVSLASAAKAEEKANMMQTALSSTTLSGYVDTGMQWNFGTGNSFNPPYRFGGPDKADGFNLNVVQVRIEKPLDEADWSSGYRVDLWAGPDANSLGSQSITSGSASDFAIRQAYVALRTPVGNGIDWKVGVFDSIIGYESVEGPNNPNYTRSYGNSIEPTTMTGVLASYRFTDMISASVGVANTVGAQINGRASDPYGDKAESFKSYMGSIAVTAPDSMGFLAGSTLYGGFVTGFGDSYGGNQTSYYVGATVATPITNLRLGAAFDYLDVHNPDANPDFRGGETWALAGYASYQATEKMSLHLRGEYLRDRGDQKFYSGFNDNLVTEANPTGSFAYPDKVLAVTATLQYDLWKNVLSRLELRWDHSLDNSMGYGGTAETGPNRGNAWMLAGNIVYKF